MLDSAASSQHAITVHRSFTLAAWLAVVWTLPSSRAATVKLEITEAGSRKPIPCRIHLTDDAGQPVKAGPLPFFRNHFVCPGTAELDLKPGRYSYEIERGPEYRLVRGEFSCTNGIPATVRRSLARAADMAREGWWPGDLHVHRKTNDIQLLMQAEDLHIAPVMTWWNKENLWAGKPLPSEHLVQFDANRFYDVMAGEDEREGGALLYFNLDAPLNIANASREFPSSAEFMAEARTHRGAWVDIEKPYWWDVPVWLAHGVDSVGLACNHMLREGMYESEAWGRPRDAKRLLPPRGNGFYTQEIYYHILNSGLRLPPSAGSASGVMQNPVGYNRVYVQLDGPLTWNKWWEGLRAGRCFVSNGPLLRARANGQWPGHVFTGPRSVDLTLKAEFTSRDLVKTFEIIVNGRIERTVPFAEWQRTHSLGRLTFTKTGWFLIRTIADNPATFRFASTAPWYVEVGDVKQRVSRASAQFFLDWCRERLGRIQLSDKTQSDAVFKWHSEAERFWQRKVREANVE